MDLAPECAACASIQMARAVGHHHQSQWREVSAQGMGAIAEALAAVDARPGDVLFQMYETLSRLAAVDDPYAAEKAEANRLAEEFWRSHPLSLDDWYGRALYAVAGNVLDGGLDPDPAHLWHQFEAAVEQGFARDDLFPWMDLARQRKTVLYITDNAGEAVFDRELMRALRSFGLHIITALRSRPYLNDITVAEAAALGFMEVSDEMIDTGRRAGFHPDFLDEKALDAFRRADVVLAKGIANLETFSHVAVGVPTLFLYRSKCPPSSRLANVAPNQNVAWLSGCAEGWA